MLARSGSPTAVVGCGLAAAFGLHAGIDYVADFPAVVAVVAFTTGILALAKEHDRLHLAGGPMPQGDRRLSDQNSSTSPRESRH
jgi:hypothetical protein